MADSLQPPNPELSGFHTPQEQSAFYQGAMLGGVAANLLISELLAHETYRATHDALTGLYNRRGFIQAAGLELSLHPDKPHGILFIDLGNYKGVNDTYGHQTGDETLQKIAAKVRKSDIGGLIGRMGGDELAILADLDAIRHPDADKLTPHERLGFAAARFRNAGKELVREDSRLGQLGSDDVSFFVAVGAHLLTKPKKTSLHQGLQLADIDLYRDKEKMRRRYGTYQRTL